MKKILVILLCVILAASCLSGCNKKPVEETPPTLAPQLEISDSGEAVTYKVSGALSANMVLQQNKTIHAWGTSPNIGAYLYGEFMGETRYAQVDEEGNWDIEFSAHPYTAEAQTMKIYPKNGEVTEFTDILIGDVWAVSGQSNAELHVDVTQSYTPEITDMIDEADPIRIYYQSVFDIEANPDKLDTPQTDVINNAYHWEKADSNAVMKCSAIGYYFAKEVIRHTDVPIGIVMMAGSGYALRHFMPDDLAKERGYSTGADVFNMMIHPFLKMPIRGMLFYQGESDSWEPYNYAEDLTALVTRLRTIYGYDFPFYNVQLSSHAGKLETGWPKMPVVRFQQTDAVSMIDNSHLVATYDVGVFGLGEPEMEHPYNKKPIGDRLAYLALAEYYDAGEYDMEDWGCPIPEKTEYTDDKVVITFANVGKGLELTGNSPDLEGFYLLDEEYEYIGRIKAEITAKDEVTVTIPEKWVGRYFAVGYVCEHVAPSSSNNLVNSNGLPAVAFAAVRK